MIGCRVSRGAVVLGYVVVRSRVVVCCWAQICDELRWFAMLCYDGWGVLWWECVAKCGMLMGLVVVRRILGVVVVLRDV